MSSLRGVLRLIGLAVTAIGFLPLYALAIAVALIFGQRARYAAVKVLKPPFYRALLFCFGVKVTIEGRLDPSVSIFVGNHLSYLDIFLGSAAIGGTFVSRHDVKGWPLIGLFAQLDGTVFIDRTSIRSAVESSAAIVEKAKLGARIILFPEGGITGGGKVASFKPFLMSGVAEAGLIVQPFTLRYTHVGDEVITDENVGLVLWDDTPLQVHGWRLLRATRTRATVTFHAPIQAPPAADKPSIRSWVEELREEVASA